MQSTHPKYKWFVLFVLTIVYMFNFIDRQVMIILQEDIKRDLLLSDTQLGLMTGLAFAILYTTLGVPIAKLADTKNRKNLLVIALTFWSSMTVLSGRAQNFVQMLLTRIGVSVGEAGGVPPSHSIISDYFPLERRGTALSIYSMGIPLGIFMGFVIAGLIAKSYGWRMAFYVLGLGGLVVAIFTYFLLKEPIRGRFDAKRLTHKKTTIKETFQTILGIKTFTYMALGAGFTSFTFYSMNNFLPSYLQRFHGLDLLTVSVAMGVSIGIGGIIGAFIGGRIADIKGSKNKKWYLYVPIGVCFLSFIPGPILLFTDNYQIALAMVLPFAMLTSAFNGPSYAVGQSLVSAEMRASSSAIIILFINGIGLALGPLFVGWISDLLMPQYGILSLRYAIFSSFFTLIIAAYFYWKAAQHYENDLNQRLA